MKKTRRLAAILISILAAAMLLTSCGTLRECDFCGEKKICEKAETMFGEIYICKDCLKMFE